jgi:alpha-L-rhamnosidase
VKRLVENVRNRQHTIGTGFLSTPFVLPLLTENGYVEDAYTMLKQDKAPGLMYQIKNGATTIWETWTGLDKYGEVNASYNHYAFGCITERLFSYSAGIRITDTQMFTISPFPGGD